MGNYARMISLKSFSFRADALPAKRVLQVQAILSTFAALIALPFGPSPAASVALGGITCLVANGLSAIWIFRAYEARHPDRLLLRMYGAEVVKLAVVIGIFGVAFAFLEGLRITALVAAYLFVQVASAPIAMQFANRPTRRP